MYLSRVLYYAQVSQGENILISLLPDIYLLQTDIGLLETDIAYYLLEPT